MATARNRLPELIRAVEAGEKVVITRHGKPVAPVFSAGWDSPVDPDRFLRGDL